MAVALDGASWREDAAALREVATEADVPVPRGVLAHGRGAHVWVLFGRPVAGRVARSVASWLLTQAMSRRSIAMDAYDRLFPNQDTMPASGLGNLIALALQLPLQRERRARGCMVFLEESMQAHTDQWAYLAGVSRLDGDRAELLAHDAERTGATLSLAHCADGGTAAPARRLTCAPVSATIVTARLARRLELDVADLALGLVDRLRRTAAFANAMP